MCARSGCGRLVLRATTIGETPSSSSSSRSIRRRGTPAAAGANTHPERASRDASGTGAWRGFRTMAWNPRRHTADDGRGYHDPRWQYHWRPPQAGQSDPRRVPSAASYRDSRAAGYSSTVAAAGAWADWRNNQSWQGARPGDPRNNGHSYYDSAYYHSSAPPNSEYSRRGDAGDPSQKHYHRRHDFPARFDDDDRGVQAQTYGWQERRGEGSSHRAYSDHERLSPRSTRAPPSRTGGQKGKSTRSYDSSKKHHQSADVRRSTPEAPAKEHTRTTKHQPILRPRPHYLRQSICAPRSYPTQQKPPAPLPLLVLDLNGTLVFRRARNTGPTSERSRRPVLRPYLGCFLQYCLAVQSPQEHFDKRALEWTSWDAMESEKQETEAAHSIRPHGSHFWGKNVVAEPVPGPEATFRLLLWSSAQPQNVDLMARAILSPPQAEQLLRVYARDTLVIRRLYGHKAPSVKDLEILWAALNNADARRGRGESRLFADARDRERDQVGSGEGQGYEEELRALWESSVALPIKVEGTEEYRDGQGYGPHNTLLLDDSVDKARLQPFNHILVPEFDQRRAKIASQTRESQMRSEGNGVTADETAAHQTNDDEDRADSVEPPAEEVDDILLQVVGVLEHARHQTNVSSWIRFGGLGDVGGMASQHPCFLGDDMGGTNAADASEGDGQSSNAQGIDRITNEVAACFSQASDLDGRGERNERRGTPEQLQDDQAAIAAAVGSSRSLDSISAPQLHVRVEDRTPAFWAHEGRQALLRGGIEPRMFG